MSQWYLNTSVRLGVWFSHLVIKILWYGVHFSVARHKVLQAMYTSETSCHILVDSQHVFDLG